MVSELSQRERFEQHCRLFYSRSLSSPAEIDDAPSNLSNEVLNTFNLLLSGNPPSKDIILKCGLDKLTKEKIVEFSQIRDLERKKAHEDAITHRRKEFISTLKRSRSLEQNTSIKTSQMSEIEQIFREFVTRYKDCLGIHPFFAGLREFFETQLNEDKIVHWHVKSIAITESFDADDEFFERISKFLLSCLLVVDDESDEHVLCWEFKHCLNKRRLRKCLSLLPHRASLHAKPTGDLFTTNVKRNEEKDWWCIWIC